jgi:hypothetical protein
MHHQAKYSTEVTYKQSFISRPVFPVPLATGSSGRKYRPVFTGIRITLYRQTFNLFRESGTVFGPVFQVTVIQYFSDN